MSLVKCEDCKNEISEIASQCPFCGRVYGDITKREEDKMRSQNKGNRNSFCKGFLLGVLVAAIFFYFLFYLLL